MTAPTPGSEALSNAKEKYCRDLGIPKIDGHTGETFEAGWDARDTETARLTKIEERAKEWRDELTPGSYCELSEAGIYERLTCVLEGGGE